MPASDNNLDLLRAAIAGRAGIVLSLPASADGTGASLRHFKSRFLADGGDGLWVASVPGDAGHIEALVERRAIAGVSFRWGQLKVMFAAAVLHAQADYSTGAGGGGGGGAEQVGAILLRFPDARDVRAVQRRRAFRVPVPPESGLTARVWLLAEDAHLRDKPPAKAELRCDVCDLSAAGVGLVLHGGADGRPPAARRGDRLRVQLATEDSTLLLEGRLCYPPRALKDQPGRFRAGVRFGPLNEGREDRATKVQLDRLVADLQRQAIRRQTLGAA